MQEPGAAEICELLWETMRPSLDAGPSIRLETLKKEVYRLHLGSGRASCSSASPPRSANGPPRRGALAARARLRGSLPAAPGSRGDTGRSPVWHVYEDLGHETLAVDRRPSVWRPQSISSASCTRMQRATRSSRSPVAGTRPRSALLHADLRDAIAALEALVTPLADAPANIRRRRERC